LAILSCDISSPSISKVSDAISSDIYLELRNASSKSGEESSNIVFNICEATNGSKSTPNVIR